MGPNFECRRARSGVRSISKCGLEQAFRNGSASLEYRGTLCTATHVSLAALSQVDKTPWNNISGEHRLCCDEDSFTLYPRPTHAVIRYLGHLSLPMIALAVLIMHSLRYIANVFQSRLFLCLFQSLFSVSDLVSAVTLTLESSSFRWMLLVAGGGTWAAGRSGVFRGKVRNTTIKMNIALIALKTKQRPSGCLGAPPLFWCMRQLALLFST